MTVTPSPNFFQLGWTVERAKNALLGAVRPQQPDIEVALSPEVPQGQDVVNPQQKVKGCGPHEFTWNNRRCQGTELHKAALEGNLHRLEELLDNDGSRTREEFGYLTKHKGEDQFCTGEAIHLAASRGHQNLVEALLQRNADINSMVKRQGVDNYDVLQAAVFKEGRGGARDGDRQLIRYLCDNGADILNSYNANGLSCMHVAFQTGDPNTIKLVQDLILQEASRQGEIPCLHSIGSDTSNVPDQAAKLLALYDLEEVDFTDPSREDRDKTPLEIGIKFRKMDKDALAEAAPKSLSSLRVFIHCAPECIPLFMDKLCSENDNRTISEVLADKMSSKDIAKLLRDFPEAAASILQSVTSKPKVISEGWHPLPSRVSFASRSRLVRALSPFLRVGRFYTRYESEKEWSYDDEKYKEPEWHKKITQCEEPPIFDAMIQVCCIPNIISPNFFSAVLDASERVQPDALFLFKCVPIRAAVSYTFWNGAIWVDVAQFLVSVWGLGLLLVETFLAHEAANDPKTLENNISRVFEPSFITQVYKRGVVADWIIAKGIVDLLLEVAQFWGTMVIGEPMSYMRPGNLWDLLRSILPILLLWQYDSRVLQTFIVLIYWMRLLEGVTYSERIGHALLPLHKLASGLMPAMTFTLVGFCTLSHAMYTVQLKPEHLWPQSVFHTFDTLITQGLPKEPPRDMLQLSLLYAGVLFFSIFVMNIFIGVISEQYTKEKEQVAEMFQSLRASSCYTFLLRMCVIPCNLLTKKAAAVVAACSVALTFGLQVASLLFSRQLPGFFQLFAFILCQMVIFMASVQCQGKDYAWEKFSFCSRSELAFSRSYSTLPESSPRNRKDKRYLWICQPRDLECLEGEKQMQELCRGLPRGGSSDLEAGSEQSINDALLPVLRQAIREELGGSSRLATYGSSQPPRDLSSGSIPEVTRPPQSTFPNLLRKESRGAPGGTFNLFKRKGATTPPTSTS